MVFLDTVSCHFCVFKMCASIVFFYNSLDSGIWFVHCYNLWKYVRSSSLIYRHVSLWCMRMAARVKYFMKNNEFIFFSRKHNPYLKCCWAILPNLIFSYFYCSGGSSWSAEFNFFHKSHVAAHNFWIPVVVNLIPGFWYPLHKIW